MRFTKMHGIGNDYLFVDCFANPAPSDPARVARQISDRHFGVGSDGLILIRPSQVADARMQMFNADGSEAQMCGNGIRCLAKYVFEQGLCPNTALQIETGAGILAVQLEVIAGQVQQIRVDMGTPILKASDIPTTFAGPQVVDQQLSVANHTFQVTCVSMGNPHCIIFVEAADDDLVLQVGPQVERDRHFPERVNVEFVEVLSPSMVRQRTWERGSGETLACGTGASAVCVAGVLSGRTQRRITNHLLGGDLQLEWNEQDGHVYMTGPAAEICTGVWKP